MIFHKISLTNIGPYRGLNTFEFPIYTDSNTILIGGKNGAGKTTFLTGVRLALYGPLTYGQKTETREYYRKIHSLLNNQALKYAENNFRVRIDFSMVEDFQRINCSIYRNWTVKDEQVKEQVHVIKEGHHLNEAEKDVFFTSLRTNFPPSLLELCLFDGEEIAKIISNDRISEYLNGLSLKIFNLDLFNNLEIDLSSYVSQTINNTQETQLAQEEAAVKQELFGKKQQAEKLLAQRNERRDTLESLTLELEQIKKDFSLHGGLVQEEREQISQEISSVETQRKVVNEQIKEFISKDLPFFITRSLMGQAVQQLENEEDYHISEALKKKITNLPISEILLKANISSSSDSDQTVKSLLLEQLVSDQKTNLVHHASNTEAQQVKSFFHRLNDDRLSEFTSSLQQNKDSLANMQTLKQKLKVNEGTSEFEKMILDMERLNRLIHQNESEQALLEGESTNLINEINELTVKLEKISTKLFNLRKENSSFIQSQKIMSVSQKFRELQLRNKMKDVEYFASKMFKDLMRKKAFINQIKIHPNTFNIQVIDSNNDVLDKDILSAGEKELLILSIIWGIFTSSKRELPFIFDTLLGRLDLEHKAAIVTRLIPKFGRQVIVLSTDSEIDRELHTQIQGHIAKEYTLNFDSQIKQTRIESGFFNSSAKEVPNS
ncbi:DNA sulfur modification protein DndD [Bacillus aerolatus]|uniref:DNA sulfur modification protein DndD n=1 Tax=Bacillus aerolatus TaxID=2653354 RepID=UPI00177ECDDF|nr:DNA sulfur modification protein DndD [Bacillus aerolatus]